ncbi:4'-phosphopantetheinyl transferase superfamily protein [Motilimonas cestriensis]|uniref:Enterobactin synthase component D n=1 Tax=Motilimonas cestriensis TaxID=2742685 RepID=A0ABS8WCZ6_9GAMM|nr:4'-phosphopantetheinyl transferase superfamily protein [Motilimonas cestriensis]MCE2595220.1 4'-phosphopantetheinyl transferase superfamily protein [Motilimonas cestriensis]
MKDWPLSCGVELVAKTDGFIEQIETVVFPRFPNLVIVKCHFAIGRYQQGMFDLLGVSCPEVILNSVNKRQAEFLAGRFCSQQALGLLSIEQTSIDIGKNRAPKWPDNVIGSITHSNQVAMAAVTDTSCYQYIGIDCERVMEEELANSIASTIVTNGELDLLASVAVAFPIALTFAFSSKEAMFKALYPKVGYYFDFTAAEIIKVDLPNNLIVIQLVDTLCCDYVRGDIFKCYVHLENHHIVSVIAQ